MRTARTRHLLLLVAAAGLAALIITGCAKKPMWGDPESGLILTYRMAKGRTLTYRYTNDFTQEMEVMGQKMETTANELYRFSIAPRGMKGDDLLLSVTIDSTSMSLSSPQGDMSPDMSGISGKSFEMVLSVLGRELEMTGTDALMYEVPGQGERSIESSFRALFPDLPVGPVKVGDSWTSADSIPDKSENGEMLLVFSNTHTLYGYETVNGMECAVITTEIDGTMHGTAKQGGMDFIIDAVIDGFDTWHFAYKKGVFVKSASEGTANGTIKDTGGQGFNIPMKRQYEMNLSLVEMR